MGNTPSCKSFFCCSVKINMSPQDKGPMSTGNTNTGTSSWPTQCILNNFPVQTNSQTNNM